MPHKSHKSNKLLLHLLYLIVISTPLISYYVFVLHYTKTFMLSSHGYFQIWFWNILSSGKYLKEQFITPRPLLVFLYGMPATSHLLGIELIKVVFMLITGYGVFKLTYRLSEDRILSLLTEILIFILPFTIKNMAFGTDVFITFAFIVWAVYFYLEEQFYLTSLLLFLGGLVRMEVWIITIFLIFHSKIVYKKFKYTLLLGLLAPILWSMFDFFLTANPMYSILIPSYYLSITGSSTLNYKEILTEIFRFIKTFYGLYLFSALSFAFLFVFIKRERETLLFALLSIILLFSVFIASVYTGIPTPNSIFISTILFVFLLPFFIKSILSFTFKAVEYIFFLFIILATIYPLKKIYDKIKLRAITEKTKQETVRQMAPEVSVIFDKKVLIPFKSIGMFSYLNRTAYTKNILNEFNFAQGKFQISKLNYIVFIKDYYDERVSNILSPLSNNNIKEGDIIRITNNVIIQNLYTTQNKLGKIFKVFVSKEMKKEQIIQE